MPFDPYDKHFWRFADEYPAIYNDDAALALWHRLVRLAGMAWPSAGTLPYGTKKRALKMLTEADPQLVYLEAGGQFRIRGMDKERAKRQQSARNAANSRWGKSANDVAGNVDGDTDVHAQDSRWSDANGNAGGSANGNATGNANGNAESMPSRDRAEIETEVPTKPRVLLTAEQLAAWEDFSNPGWQPFKAAWLAKGFLLPPNGEWDDQESQRALLWEIADAQPDELAKWVRASRSRDSHSVVAYVLERWHAAKRKASKRADAQEAESGAHKGDKAADAAAMIDANFSL